MNAVFARPKLEGATAPYPVRPTLAVRWVQTVPSKWVAALVAGQLAAAVLFAWLAITLGDWLAGVLAALAVLGAVWHARLLVRLRRATLEGAVPVSAGPEAPLTYRATHTRGARSRPGIVVIVGDAAAFVPTGPWRHLATRLAHTLLTIRLPIAKIVLVRSPQSRQELEALVRAEDGVLLDETWAWAPSSAMLMHRHSQDVVTSRLPASCRARWPRLAADPVARRRVTRRLLLGSVAVAGPLAGLGVVGWLVTGDADLLVAGLCFAGLVLAAVGSGIWAASRRT